MDENRSVLSRTARQPDAVVRYGPDAEQIADVYFGDERSIQRPLVIVVHGGFWRPEYDRVHAGPMAEALSAAGWTVASTEYRRIPHDPDVTLHDVARALEVLPARVGRHDGRVILVGHSAGGHLVLWATVQRRTPVLAGTLALAPVADLRMAHERNLDEGAVTAFLGTDPRGRTDVDPRQLGAPPIPTTLVHGAEDSIVPLAISESYVATHRAVRFVRLDGTGHFEPIDPTSHAWPTVIAELHALG